jgi:hypothetical protein
MRRCGIKSQRRFYWNSARRGHLQLGIAPVPALPIVSKCIRIVKRNRHMMTSDVTSVSSTNLQSSTECLNVRDILSSATLIPGRNIANNHCTGAVRSFSRECLGFIPAWLLWSCCGGRWRPNFRQQCVRTRRSLTFFTNQVAPLWNPLSAEWCSFQKMLERQRLLKVLRVQRC